MTNIIENIDFPKARADKRPSLPPIMSARALGAIEFPPVSWVVPGILPTGCSLLAGRPKIGKSWVALDIALAVARGDYCLGDRACAKGEVLYLALEDNPRRLQSRIAKITVAGSPDRWPERLEMATQWPRADKGGTEAIRRWAEAKPNPRLVIVDVLAQWRPVRSGADGSNSYEGDYASIKCLQELASDLDIGVLVVHHVRKSQGEADAFEKISGTLGLSGAADTALVLDRDSAGASLYGRGRDIAEFEFAVAFSKDDCRWTIQGEAADVRRGDERSGILAALSTHGPLSPADIATATEMTGNSVRQLLFKMVAAGEVRKLGRGLYAHPDGPGEDEP